MTVNIFIIGRPGSGKSEASRDIVRFARNRGISTGQVNDYDILYEMFLADQNNQQFKPYIENRNPQFRHINDKLPGFEVIDFKVLDTALREVEKCIEKMEHVAQLTTIEFARKDYKEAFREFSSALLRGAYFLYIETSVDICVQRVKKRSTNHNSVPESIIRDYYKEDNRTYMDSQSECHPQFVSDYNIPSYHVMIIENEGPLASFKENVRTCIAEIFAAEEELLPDTEKSQKISIEYLNHKQSMEQM
ncbi:MAG: DEAD/DEAH box helicase family protein [Ktedonobacteraceae bacterium]